MWCTSAEEENIRFLHLKVLKGMIVNCLLINTLPSEVMPFFLVTLDRNRKTRMKSL